MNAMIAVIINAVMSFLQVSAMVIFIIAAIAKVIERAIPANVWFSGMIESTQFVITIVCTFFA
jgi:hypothetical protein